MQARFTQAYVSSLKPSDKPFWISDTGCQNLRLYVGASGKVWYTLYRDADGKKQSHKLGPAAVFTVAEARNEATKIAARVINGETLKEEKQIPSITLGEFLEKHYRPWVIANRKSGEKTAQSITSAFDFLLTEPLSDLSLMRVEQWRTKKVKDGRKAATTNRLTAVLKSSLNWAVKHKFIEDNPLKTLERMAEHDSDIKVRYLSTDERKRLMSALDNRERRIRQERKNHNAWLSQRHIDTKPELNGEFADYLKPLVIVSLYSGMRRGSLFGLKWSDVNLSARTITLRGANNKSGKTVHIPINSVVVNTLDSWRKQNRTAKDSDLVFPSPVSGGKLDNVKNSWAAILKEANITNFRWHDMRHDFASQLVMKGVDLNTVRELMGHADMNMTLRYAHLAPNSKLKAVEVLADIAS